MELIVLLVVSLCNPLFTWSLLADVFFFLDIDTVVIFFPFFNNGFNDAPHYVINFFFPDSNPDSHDSRFLYWICFHITLVFIVFVLVCLRTNSGISETGVFICRSCDTFIAHR